MIMRLPIRSAFELLEVRLGRPIRQAGSIAYVVGRLVWMSLILYVSSTILVNVAGCDPKWRELFTLVTGIVTITYTVLGGIRTVMVTEVFQSCVLFLGVILTIILISVQIGGVGEVVAAPSRDVLAAAALLQPGSARARFPGGHVRILPDRQYLPHDHRSVRRSAAAHHPGCPSCRPAARLTF